MDLALNASSTLRHMTLPDDTLAFVERNGGDMGNTMHCAWYVGTPTLWDHDTREFVTSEGIALNTTMNLNHLADQLAVLHEQVLAESGYAAHVHGAVIPMQSGTALFRVYDLIHPELPLHRYVNLLADLFGAGLDSALPHVGAAQHLHTGKLNSETRIKRWLKPWKTRQGCGGVFVKSIEFVYRPGTEATDAVLVTP